MYVRYDDIAWWWYYYIIKNITFQRSNKAQWRLGAQQRIYATKNPLHKEINQPMMRQLGDAQHERTMCETHYEKCSISRRPYR